MNKICIIAKTWFSKDFFKIFVSYQILLLWYFVFLVKESPGQRPASVSPQTLSWDWSAGSQASQLTGCCLLTQQCWRKDKIESIRLPDRCLESLSITQDERMSTLPARSFQHSTTVVILHRRDGLKNPNKDLHDNHDIYLATHSL